MTECFGGKWFVGGIASFSVLFFSISLIAISASSNAEDSKETMLARMEIMYGFTEECEINFKILSKDPDYLTDSQAQVLVSTHAIIAENEYFFDESRVREYDRLASELIAGYSVKKRNASTMWQRKFYYGTTPENPFSEEETNTLNELKSKLIKKYRDERENPLYASIYKLGSAFDKRTLYCYYNSEDKLIESKVVQQIDNRGSDGLIDSIIQLIKGNEENLGDLSVMAKYRYTINVNFKVPKASNTATDGSAQ